MNRNAHEAAGQAAAAGSDAGAHEHPSWRFYLMVAAILTVITAAEVAVFYIPAMKPALAPILITLSSAKFAMVVMFYMHLKFDANVFRGVFVAPLILALLVVISLVILFRVLPAFHYGG
jgi:cytochrome c oxidase subunit 4